MKEAVSKAKNTRTLSSSINSP